jgi:Prenyltransferase and squalene oxidase repeat
MSTVRRRRQRGIAAALAAATVALCAAATPAAADAPRPGPAHSASPSPSPSARAHPAAKHPAAGKRTATAGKKAAPHKPALPAGLFGTGDPTHDGVWRQSLAMLGQYAVELRPGNPAIRWLKGQQCADGSFPEYRAAPSVPCDRNTVLDTDATAVAVQALASLGDQHPAISAAKNWLRTQQNPDGGWGRTPGAPTDATTTSLVIGALAMTGGRPSSMRSPFTGKQAYDALTSLSVPCGAEGGSAGDGGAFAAEAPAPGTPPVADQDATAEALLGGIGKRFVVAPVKPGPAPTCLVSGEHTVEGSARNGAAYLAGVLAREGHLADVGATADAVNAMCAAGYGDKAVGALHWLEANGAAWARRTGPAGYAKLIFAAHTAGVDPHHFGNLDLVRALNAMGPAPRPVPRPLPSTTPTSSPSPTPSDLGIDPHAEVAAASSPVLPDSLWYAGIAAIVLIAAGVVAINRRAARREH